MAIDRETLRRDGFPPGIKITAEVMKSLSERQNKVLSRFSDATKKRNLLLEKIDLCQNGKPNAAGIIGFSDGSIAVHRNKSDQEKTIKKFQKDLEEPNETMTSILNEALDYGLGHLKIIQKYCQKFDVKP